MIKKLLSGRVRYTLSECAQEWDCPEQAILELATKGEINLQAYLEYTEGVYVFNDNWDELESGTWKGFQTLSLRVCEILLVCFDEKVPITSIVATQKERDAFNLDDNVTVEIRLDRQMAESGLLDPLDSSVDDPFIGFQFITIKDVWISREEFERLSTENKDDHGNLDRNTDETFEEPEKKFKKYDEKQIRNLKNNRFDELSHLLKDILQKEEDKGEDISANAIWNVLKKELKRKNRKYDKNGILTKFDPSTTSSGKLYWTKGKNKIETPCNYRTLENKLAKIRKNNH